MKKSIIYVVTAFALVFLFILFQKISHNSKVKKWPSVEGVVELSLVKKEYKNVKYRYKPFIKYRYTVENKRHEKVYYDYTSSGFLKEEHALKITNRFPEGETIIVHYNPDNPDDSVLADLP